MNKVKMYLLFFCIGFSVISCTSDNLNLIPDDDSEEQESEAPEEENTEEEEATPDEDVVTVDIATELTANDLEPHPMQDVAKPGYLETIVDHSFGTIIRRISNGGYGTVTKPIYSTE